MEVRLQIDVESFRQNGYVIVRGVFSTAEVAKFRELLGKVRDRALASGGFDGDPAFPGVMLLRGDLLSMRELRDVDYIVLDRRVLECVRQLLGPELVYHGDSSVQVGEGSRGFHKDNADRGDPSGLDWKGEYRVLRAGIYLQDHERHSGGLKVRRHSHRFVSHHRGRAVNLGTLPGDIVFWSLTTSHSGNFVRVRGVPGLCLHPRLERLVPRALRVAEAAERLSVFCSYGAPGTHLDRYIEYQSRRSDVTRHWLRCGVGAELDALAASRGVQLRRPTPEFGSESCA